jgi:hypothetical protein
MIFTHYYTKNRGQARTVWSTMWPKQEAEAVQIGAFAGRS